jgi:hypothetical protein
MTNSIEVCATIREELVNEVMVAIDTCSLDRVGVG